MQATAVRTRITTICFLAGRPKRARRRDAQRQAQGQGERDGGFSLMEPEIEARTAGVAAQAGALICGGRWRGALQRYRLATLETRAGDWRIFESEKGAFLRLLEFSSQLGRSSVGFGMIRGLNITRRSISSGE